MFLECKPYLKVVVDKMYRSAVHPKEQLFAYFTMRFLASGIDFSAVPSSISITKLLSFFFEKKNQWQTLHKLFKRFFFF